MSRLFSGRRASVGPSNGFRRNQSTTGPTAADTSRNTNNNNSNSNPPSTTTLPPPVSPPSVPSAALNNLSDAEIKGLLQRVESKLPCNSGQRLAALPTDPVLAKAVDALVDFAPQCGDFVLVGLARILDKLKKTRVLPDGTVPDQVLDSQLSVLKIMNRVMARRYPDHSNPNVHNSTSLAHSQPVPPSLDIQALLYIVYVLCTCLPAHLLANIAKYRYPRHIVEREPGLGTGAKGPLPSTVASLPILEPTPSPEAMYAHSYTQDEALHGLYFASVGVLIAKYTTRLFYHLSASNWPTIHLLFKTRLQLLVDGVVPINGTTTVTTSRSGGTTTKSSSSKPGSSSGISTSSPGSVIGNVGSQALAQFSAGSTSFGKYSLPSAASSSNVSSVSGPGAEAEKEGGGGGGGGRSGISVGLLKKGRGEKEKERERERERIANANASSSPRTLPPLSTGDPVSEGLFGGFGFPGGNSGGPAGPASPRSFGSVMQSSSSSSGSGSVKGVNMMTTASSTTLVGGGAMPAFGGSGGGMGGGGGGGSFVPQNLDISVVMVARLNGLSSFGVGHGQGIRDIIFKAIAVSMVDSTKLLDIFTDIIKSFPHLPNEAQDQVGILIRDLIVNFADTCPREFWKIWGVGSGVTANGGTSGIGTAYKDKAGAGGGGVGDAGWAIAERLYDLIWDMFGATRRLPAFYAPLASLLCLLPARFEANLEVMESRNSGKKSAFFKHISQAVRARPANSGSTGGNNSSTSGSGGSGGGGIGTLFGLGSPNSSHSNTNGASSQQQQQQGGGGSLSHAAQQQIMASIPEIVLQPHELAAQAVLDVLRLGYSIPPSKLVSGSGGADEKGREALLRAASDTFGGILKDYLFHNPQTRTPFFLSPEPIDVDFHVYCIAALFRLWPEVVLRDVIMTCLEPEKSFAVKYIAVKAIVLLIVEQPKYPYQPNLELVWPVIVSRMRSLFISCISGSPEVIDGTARMVTPVPICRTTARAKAYAQALGLSQPNSTVPSTSSIASGSNSSLTSTNHNLSPNANGNAASGPSISSVSSVCSSTSGSIIPLPGVIKEELRLYIIIATILPIELKCWLYKVVPDDHVYLMQRAASVLESHRDRRDQATAVMALRSVVNACCDAGVNVKEGLEFLNHSAPGAFINCSVVLTTCAEEIDFVRTTITCLHTLLTRATLFSSDERENVWRAAPFLHTVMDLVEFSFYISLTSNQQDISCYAQQSLKLISVYERLPGGGKPTNLSDAQWAKRTAFLESFDNPLDPPNIHMGRVAFQKRVRKLMQQLPFLCPMHIMAFKELWFRFSKLAARVGEPGFNSSRDGKDRDDLYEWQNTMYLLATCIYREMEEDVPPYPVLLMPMLPPRLTSGARMTDMSTKFVAECIKHLASDNVQVREYAKEALGAELNFMLLPVLFEQLDNELTRRLGSGSGIETIIPPSTSSSSSNLTFVDQCLVVLRMNFDRINGTVTVFDNNATANLLQIGQFISRLSSNPNSGPNFGGKVTSSGTISSSGSFGGDSMCLRLRSKFCITVASLLAKRQFFAIREEMLFRSQLCDILINWLDEHNDGLPPPGEVKLSNETFMSVLKLFTLALENLQLQANNTSLHVLPVNSDPDQIIAQKAAHYITSITRTLKVQEIPAGSVINLSLDSLSSQDDAAIIHELVVTGITHLLQNNSKATKLRCLGGCYDSNILLRAVYMKAFTRVLALGTKLDMTQNGMIGGSGGRSEGGPVKGDEICKLLRNSDLITFAVVEACPQNEVENIVPVLIRLYDTPEKLLAFLKATINREITKTESPASLLRLNTLCARIITSFARLHAYIYLRNSIRYLVDIMLDQIDHPEHSSFEIEPSKLQPHESLDTNINLVFDVVKKFLSYLMENVDSIPKSIRQVCHHIAETVSTTWPESKYPALGAFFFLRFLCPSIVAPENVNITGYEYNINIRRGLVTVARILQSMSNQIPYGREAHNEQINFFLLENKDSVLDFLTLIQESDSEHEIDESVNLYPGTSEADVLVLHRFLQTHADQIGQQLLESKDPTPSSKGGNATMTAKQAWDTLCTLLVDTKSWLEGPRLSQLDDSRHTSFQNFMRRNHRRNTDAVAETFKFENVVDNAAIFVFTWAKVDMDVVDFELLLYHVFKRLTEPSISKLDVDIIFDFTAFTPRSQLPTAWIKLFIELLPANVRQRWRSVYALNITTEALAFIQKVTSLFHGLELARQIYVPTTFAELKTWFVNIPSLMENSLPAALEANELHTYQNVHYQVGQQQWTAANVYIGTDHIRIVSVIPEKLHSDYVASLVEVVHLRDIEDVFRGGNQQRIMLRQYYRRPTMTFEVANRDLLLKAIKAAKKNYTANNPTPLLPSAQTSDTCATLLAVGLLHASDRTELVRGTAYKLLDANCAYIGYPFDALIPWRSSLFPINPSAFIVPFSERIAGFSPGMTLDFIIEWSGGLANATSVQKSISLQYIAPWIRNLPSFIDPTNPLYNPPGLRKCLQVFVNITMQDQEVYAILQNLIWPELARLAEPVSNMVLEELVQAALNDGLDSQRCELAADTLIAFSSLPIRTRVLNQLRELLETAFDRPIVKIIETPEWKSITVLSRLSLAAGHGIYSQDANRHRAGEAAHIITMLAGVGSLTMRMSIHGMALNLLQTLYNLHGENETVGMQLRGIIDELNSAAYLKIFGICRPYPSGDIVLHSSDSNVAVDDLEKLTKLLLRALLAGATSVGIQNIWKVRWMGELSKTAFLSSPYAQYRAFVVLGALAEIKTEEYHLYQWLELLRRNILAENVDVCLAILRCLSNVVRTFVTRPKIAGSLFWLAVAMLHTGVIPLRTEALKLMKASVETLEKYNVFKDSEAEPSKNPVETFLMQARESIRDGAERLEVLNEVSFEKSFGWALVALFWKNVRTRSDSNVTKDIMMSMLRIAMRHSPGATSEERKSLDSLTMPLLMGMAPCYDRRSYERFLEQECYIVDPFRSMGDGKDDDDYHLNTDLLGIHNSQDAMLAFTFFLTVENNAVNGLGAIEHLHFLWAELAKTFPDECTCPVWHFKETAPPEWMQKKYETAFSSGMSDAHIRAVSSCFDLMISRVANTTPEGTPNASLTSLPQSLTDSDSPSTLFLTKMNTMGLNGLWKPLLRYANIEAPTPPEKVRNLKVAAAEMIHFIPS